MNRDSILSIVKIGDDEVIAAVSSIPHDIGNGVAVSGIAETKRDFALLHVDDANVPTIDDDSLPDTAIGIRKPVMTCNSDFVNAVDLSRGGPVNLYLLVGDSVVPIHVEGFLRRLPVQVERL